MCLEEGPIQPQTQGHNADKKGVADEFTGADGHHLSSAAPVVGDQPASLNGAGGELTILLTEQGILFIQQDYIYYTIALYSYGTNQYCECAELVLRPFPFSWAANEVGRHEATILNQAPRPDRLHRR